MRAEGEITAIIKFGGIGDILMASPAIRAYKNARLSERIVAITGEGYRSLFDANPYVDDVVCVDEHWIYSKNHILRLWGAIRLISLVRRIKPDSVFVLHRDWRWNLLVMVAGIKRRYGFARDLDGRFLTRSARQDDSMHETEKYYNIFGLAAPVEFNGWAMDLPAGRADVEGVDTLLRESGIDVANGGRKLIAIAPGGAKNAREEMELRRWPLSQYRKLVELILEETEWIVVLVGAACDIVYTARLVGSSKQVVDVAGKTSVVQTTELLRRCSALVANDSGPMHLGAASGIPVVGIFGPTNPVEKTPHTNPYSSYIWRGQDLPCSPCYRDGIFPSRCPYEHRCMTELRVEDVFRKLKAIVGEAPSGPHRAN